MSKKLPLNIRLLRLTFHYLGLLAPLMVAKQAQKIWVKTHRFPLPEREKQWQAQASTSVLPFRDYKLTYYQWGKGDKKVLLIHGWSGRALQMAAFAQPLVDSGFAVYAVDLPAHGDSTGESTDGVECAAAIQHICKELGGFDTIIAHSFGALCSIYVASHGLDCKVVAISPPEDVSFLVDEFSRGLNIPEKAIQLFRQLLETEFGEDIWQRFKISDVVKKLKQPGLLIHDENDRLVPIHNSELIHQHWQGSKMVRSKGLGHHRILRDDGIVRSVLEFILLESKNLIPTDY